MSAAAPARSGRGIPRLYAAASLKLAGCGVDSPLRIRIPRLYAAASLKHLWKVPLLESNRRIPRLYAAASLKLYLFPRIVFEDVGIPRLYAAASLKRPRQSWISKESDMYSAALCRGLIEARCPAHIPTRPSGCIPRLYAAASLKRRIRCCWCECLGFGIPRLYAAASLKQAFSAS